MKPIRLFPLLLVLIAGIWLITLSSCSKDVIITVPSLTTMEVIEVTDTSAKVSGVVNDNGGASITERGICYNTSSNPTITDNSIRSGSGTGTFDCTLTGLDQLIQYFYKTYAINSAGIGYSEQKTFSIPGPCPGIPTIIDPRDGKVYHTVQIGNQCWLKENLNVGTMIPGLQSMQDNDTVEKYCYNNDEDNCHFYGGFYQWAEVVQYLNGATNYTFWNPVPTGNVTGICPDGWHIPSHDEWIILADFLGGAPVAGNKMKTTGTIQEGNGLWLQPNFGATNESGFTALPGGKNLIAYRPPFRQMSDCAEFWSSSLSQLQNPWTSRRAFCYSLRYLHSGLDQYQDSRHNGLSVRCIKD